MSYYEQSLTDGDVSRFIQLGDKHQYEGSYSEATKKYLQVLEIIYEISITKSEKLEKIESLNSTRSIVFSKLGDNFIFLGQYEIAQEFYEQQLRITARIENIFWKAFAYHKLGLCHYYMRFQESSTELQHKSLDLIPKINDIEYEELRCQIYLYLGLNNCSAKEYKSAIENYKISLKIAKRNNLKDLEAEILIHLSTSSREKLRAEYDNLNLDLLENIIGDLHCVRHIADRNPYLKASAFREMAKVYENIDVNIAQRYFEDALVLAQNYNLAFSNNVQSDLENLLENKIKSVGKDFSLEDQEWYCKDFPKIEEVTKEIVSKLEFQTDFVIITATPIELKAVVNILKADDDKLPCRFHTKYGQYYLGIIGHYKVVVTQCRMGTRDERGAGFITHKALENWEPKAVIMVGIAFGKDSTSQQIGDVLVATEIIDYDVQRVELDGIIDRGSRPPSNRALLGLFEQAYEWEFERPDHSFSKLIPGPILSGDKLIDSPKFKANLFKRFPTAKGGEMEGIGFCSAANSLKIPWLLVKSICDWADGNKNDNYQPLAAAAAVDLVNHVLSQKTILECFE